MKLKTVVEKPEAASTAGKEDVTMDMRAFPQLYFGAFSAAELQEAGA